MPGLLHSVGTRIRKARKVKRFTQAEVAKKLGVTQAAVSHWERGKADVGIDQLNRLATMLSVPLRSLIEDAL